MTPAHRYLAILSGIALAAGGAPCAAAMAQATPTRIPSVGCPADGQTGPLATPPDSTRTVALDADIARQVAYYHGSEGGGVYAPRGWRCFVAYGSDGSTVVAGPSVPAPIADGDTPIRGPAVARGVADGGTSGRFEVARYAMLLFPSVAARFIADVKDDGIESDADLTLGPYPRDSVIHADSVTVEFTTPGGTGGLGTAGRLAASSDLIHGLVVLDTTEDWSLATLAIRLDPTRARLADALFNLNKACIRSGAGC